MEVSLPSLSWRGKGSCGFGSCLLDWERGCFTGLLLWKASCSPASICSAHDWPSPALPVSMGAGVEEWVTGASAPWVSPTGASTIGVSVIGATVAPALVLLELGTWTSCFTCKQRDLLGATWGHLGRAAPIRCKHSWRQPCRATSP